MSDAAWPRNRFDSFILARLEAAKLKPSPEAVANTVAPGSSRPDGTAAYCRGIDAVPCDKRADAYERVVDKLLASPHYGERWGRHWLDLARYADSDGYTIDAPREIWKYRDWVIDALNQDMPFDQFVDRADRRRPAAEPDAGSVDRHWLSSQHAAAITKAASTSSSTAWRPSRTASRRQAPFSGPDARLRPLPRSQVRPDLAARVLPDVRLLQQRGRDWTQRSRRASTSTSPFLEIGTDAGEARPFARVGAEVDY